MGTQSVPNLIYGLNSHPGWGWTSNKCWVNIYEFLIHHQVILRQDDCGLQSKAELLHEEDGHNLIKDHKYDASVMVVKMRFLYSLSFNVLCDKPFLQFSTWKELLFLKRLTLSLHHTSFSYFRSWEAQYYVCSDLLAQRMVTHLLRLPYLEKV